MASSPLTIRAANLYREAASIKDIDELIELRNNYLNWIAEVQDNLIETKDIKWESEAALLKGDPVVQDLMINGGVGTDIASSRTQEVLALIKRSLSDWIDRGVKENFAAPVYDEVLHTLHFRGKEILISSRSQSRGTELMQVIFKNPQKNWATDEILEKWNETNQKLAPYHAAKAINQKISSEIGVLDFLLSTTKQIQINPNYL